MLTITNYSSVNLLPAKPATEGKKAPPRTVVVDGTQYLSVWQADLPALRETVKARAPIAVTVRARILSATEEHPEPRAVTNLQFAGGVNLGDDTPAGAESLTS